MHTRSLISAFVFRLLESIISRLATSEFSNFQLVSIAEQAGLSLALSETPKIGFVARSPYRHLYILMLKKKATLSFLYTVCLICIEISRSLIGQHYVEEVLHQHVLQIYQTVGINFLFQQDTASIPVTWQGTICKLVMSYSLDWRSGSDSIADRPSLGYSRLAGT